MAPRSRTVDEAAARDQRTNELNIPLLRLNDLDTTHSAAWVRLIRDDLEMVTIVPPRTIDVPPPASLDVNVPLVTTYTSLKVTAAAVTNALVAPATGIVLSGRDELICEALPTDRLITEVAAPLGVADWPGRRARVARLAGRHLVMANARRPNFYHWWFDSLSKVWLVDRFSPWTGCPLLIAGDLEPFQTDALQALGLAHRVVTVDDELVEVEEAIVCTGLGYGSAMRLSSLVPQFAAWACEHLEVWGGGQRRLLLSRAAPHPRRVVNEQQLFKTLAALGFELIRLENLDVRSQARLFAGAEIVVAPHGAGLTNLMFCTSIGVVECFSSSGAHDSLYRRLAGLLGLPYAAVVGDTVGSDMPPNAADMRIAAADVVQAVRAVTLANRRVP